jgi:hypothetical protein
VTVWVLVTVVVLLSGTGLAGLVTTELRSVVVVCVVPDEQALVRPAIARMELAKIRRSVLGEAARVMASSFL